MIESLERRTLMSSGPAAPPVTWIASPNFNSRGSTPIDAIVIHTTEESYAATVSEFQSPSAQLSAHYVVNSDGAITEMVDPANRAWHATYYNSRAVGIENVGFAGQASTWNDKNIPALEHLVAYLAYTYKVPVVHSTDNAYDYPNDRLNEPGIVAHAQVQPWDRTDPGPYFPWTKFIADVKQIIADSTTPTQAPFHGTPFNVGASAVTIQAEDFDTGGEGVAYHDVEATNRGGKYRTGEGVDIESTTDSGGGYDVGYTRAGEWMEYTINVAAAGTHSLSFRVASAAAGAKFHAEVDGANVTGSLSVPNTGGAQKWTTVTKTGVSLPAGQHVLRLAMDTTASNGALGNFNWMMVSPPPPPPPLQAPFKGTPFAVPASGTVTLQAEDFDNGGEGVAYHDADVANNGGKYRTTESVDVESTTDTAGGGYNVGWTRAGEWLEYTIHVVNAQPYNLAFRVASGAAGAKFHAEIDGTDLTGPITVPNTGGYQKWQTVLARNVTIASGDHVLRLKMDVAAANGSAGNFDYIQFSDAVVPPPTRIVQTTTTAYVQDGSSANTNFGNSAQLIAKKYAGTGYSRESFLKFDLSTLTTITSAKLRLFGRLSDTSQPSVDVGIAYTDNQSWTEGGITWNNRPTATTGVTTATISGTTTQWYEIDVTDFLRAQKALGHNTVTIVLKNSTASTAYATFNSDDAATNRPELLVGT